MKTVWVVYDPLYEKVVSAHKTEEGAGNRCNYEDNKDGRHQGIIIIYLSIRNL